MYARGLGYFDRILPALGQRASFFCLENDHWRIFAIDTGYNSIGIPLLEYFLDPDCTLPRHTIDWLRHIVRPRRDDPRGTIILSHHPYFSRFDASCPRPAQQLTEFFPGPVLWFWGHEHRLAIYEVVDQAGGIRTFGRCIGHGGMPIELRPKVAHPQFEVEFVDERHYPNDENLTIGFNGFAQLTLDGDLLTAQYVDLEGTVVFSESWTAGRGGLTRLRSSHFPP
jgi:hypothetical protein